MINAATREEIFPDLFTLTVSAENLLRLVQSHLMFGQGEPGPVIWTNHDAELIVDVDKIRLAIKPGVLLFEVTVAVDQTGTVPLIVPFRIGKTVNESSLMVITEELPRGNPLLAAQWGGIVQEALWNAVLDSAGSIKSRREKGESGIAALDIAGLYSEGDVLTLIYARPVSADEVAEYYVELREEFGDSPPTFDPSPSEISDENKRSLWQEFLDVMGALAEFLNKLFEHVSNACRQFMQRWKDKR